MTDQIGQFLAICIAINCLQINIALNDQSPELRMHALTLVAERFDAQSVPTLQQASHDPDIRVAQKAGQFLDRLSP